MVKHTAYTLAERAIHRIGRILRSRSLEEGSKGPDVPIVDNLVREFELIELNTLLFVINASHLQVICLPMEYGERAAIIDYCIDFLEAQKETTV